MTMMHQNPVHVRLPLFVRDRRPERGECFIMHVQISGLTVCSAVQDRSGLKALLLQRCTETRPQIKNCVFCTARCPMESVSTPSGWYMKIKSQEGLQSEQDSSFDQEYFKIHF